MPAIAVPIVGAFGATACGVTLFDAVDSAPAPNTLFATTVNVYAAPFVKPVTASGLVAPVAVIPDGVEVAV